MRKILLCVAVLALCGCSSLFTKSTHTVVTPATAHGTHDIEIKDGGGGVRIILRPVTNRYVRPETDRHPSGFLNGGG